MAQYSSDNYKQNGPQYLKDNVTQVMLIDDPLKSDNITTAESKAIATAVMAGTDVSFSSINSGADLLVSINGKNSIDPDAVAAITDDIALAYCSATEVILVLDVVDRELLNGAGDTINFPAAAVTIYENT